MRTHLAIFLGLIPGMAVADLDIPREEVRRCLEAAAAAASTEDLDAYVRCFEARLRPKVRKTAGLLFTQFTVGVSIEDCHVLSGDETSCDVAVRYTMHLSDRSVDLLSIMTLKRVDDTWKIRKEVVRAWQKSTVADTPFPYGGSSVFSGDIRSSCSSGSCSLSGR